MAYLPGTIFRLHVDATKHYTAVKLRNGNLLEVKNPDRPAYTTFPSLTMWRTSHAMDESALTIQTPNNIPIVESLDFHYQLIDAPWFSWLYAVMYEGTPHLLMNPDVRDAYNAFVDVCLKYNRELWITSPSPLGKYNHDPQYLPHDIWSGRNAYFLYERCYGFQSTINYTVARSEITQSYKILYDLIHADVKPFLQETYKHDLVKLKAMTREKRIQIKRKKIEKLQKEIEEMQRN